MAKRCDNCKHYFAQPPHGQWCYARPMRIRTEPERTCDEHETKDEQ